MTTLYSSEMLENTSTYVPSTMSASATALMLLDILIDISSTTFWSHYVPS